MRRISFVSVLSFAILAVSCVRHNVFSFCKDFDPNGCIGVFEQDAVYPLEKSQRTKTIRDFANSVYFRGDRLAFALLNARSKYDVTFECLHGRYTFGDAAEFKEDLEYIELRDEHVYGLVMLGSLIEKKFAAIKTLPYRALPPFEVEYAVYCRKDLIAKHSIRVVLN